MEKYSSGDFMKNLHNKVAIIIGASKGIGYGVAKVFLQKGARVVLASRNLAKLQEAQKKLRLETSMTSDIYCADISRLNETELLADYVLKKFGRIDILCQNAGIYPSIPIEVMTEENWDLVLDNNLKGTFFAVRSVIPAMKKQKYGRIVVTSSITGPRVGNPGLAHYSASKAGINGFVKTAAIELARFNITINCVEPGNIITEALKELGDHYLYAQEKAIPMGRFGTPEDVGYAEAFLASDEAKYITGQSIVVDGGQVLPESQYDIPRD